MASRHRWRAIAGWVLTLGIAAYVISDWRTPDEPKDIATSEEVEDGSGLRITAISDGEVNPGDAVVVTFAGATPGVPVEGRLAHRKVDIIARDASSAVVRIPADVPLGKVALRITQGPARSKSWDLHVKAPHYKKLVARLLGGLALFVLGLALLAVGMRGLAGERMRALLGRMTGSTPRAVAVGTLVGTGTQLTSSSAALTVGLVDSRMLATASASAVLVGAQLGASITGALIPAQLSQDSLLVIAIGVLWSRLAVTRRGLATANLVIGAGLMLYGLHLLQTSIAPLVGDPKLLPYLGHLQSPGASSLVACALTGAFLAFVLQGPGPVYVLVVGLAQTTTTLPLENALAITAGAHLGAGLGMALITFMGARTRKLSGLHVAFSIAATAIMLATVPLWTAIATRVVPDAVEYGHAIVRSRIASQLAVGFIGAELAAVAVWMCVLPTLTRRARASRESMPPDAVPLSGHLPAVLRDLRVALEVALETARSGERRRSAEADRALSATRAILEGGYQRSGDGATERDTRALISAMQLHRAVEQAVHTAELCIERDIKLTEEAKASLAAMHEIASQSFDALLAALVAERAPDLEDAGAREIEMNALEAATRAAAVNQKRTRADTAPATSIGVAELVAAFENVGNHLFRFTKALIETD